MFLHGERNKFLFCLNSNYVSLYCMAWNQAWIMHVSSQPLLQLGCSMWSDFLIKAASAGSLSSCTEWLHSVTSARGSQNFQHPMEKARWSAQFLVVVALGQFCLMILGTVLGCMVSDLVFQSNWWLLITQYTVNPFLLTSTKVGQ